MGPVLVLIALLCSVTAFASNEVKGVWRPKSQIRWHALSVTDWLDINRWVEAQDNPTRRRAFPRDPERIGTVISCIGDCQLRRGLASNHLRWLSQVEEGDEVHTGADSYLWMMLVDGTLVRLAPQSTLGLQEVNWGEKKVFFHAHLQRGYMYWYPRTRELMQVEAMTETDRLFLPVMDREANLEFFQAAQKRDATEMTRLKAVADHGELARSSQYEELNKRIIANNFNPPWNHHEALLTTPNGTIHTQAMPVTMFYAPAGRAYLKVARHPGEKSDMKVTREASFFFRGYVNTDEEKLVEDQWMEISPDGRAIQPLAEVPPLLGASEVLPRRIPTIMLVREHWVAKGLAGEFMPWTDVQINQRINFLKEHVRRLETTNLRALQRLIPTPDEQFDERYMSLALESYLFNVKRRYGFSRASVPDMIPLHYYGWVLRNARQH